MNNKSVYLSRSNRLGDVIAAIQVLGTYKFYKLDFAGWSDRITGDKGSADYWKKIFVEHPEFFRLDSKKERGSLVWRRQNPKLYNVDTGLPITKEEFSTLSEPAKLRISRSPLSSDDISTLIKTAIDLHSRALEHHQDKRWWIPLFISAIGGLIGALVGVLLKG